MELFLKLDIKKLPFLIRYPEKIMLVGSCFTAHIGNALEELKFDVLQNPHGILFDPGSVNKSLISYIEPKTYSKADLFNLNEVWYSWDHHSRFSGVDLERALKDINDSQKKAHDFLKQADWLILTLGSAFSYKLTSSANSDPGYSVANCHRAPADWFSKHLEESSQIIQGLENCYQQLMTFNPGLKIIYTISPVRHIRDGLVDNNRSKARLIESVHHIVNKYKNTCYFPAYELVIDVLRDYRFYDVDMVHPNYPATSFVLEKFIDSSIDEGSRSLMQELRGIVIARKHKPLQPGTKAHKQFLHAHFEKARALQEKFPFLDLKKELEYFDQD